MADHASRISALRGFDWNRATIAALLLVAESALVWLIATGTLALPSGYPDAIPGWFVVALLAAGVLGPMLLEFFDVWSPWYEIAMGAFVTASLLGAIHVLRYPDAAWRSGAWSRDAVQALILRPANSGFPLWGAIVLVAYAWWRGRTRSAPTIDSANLMLRAGIGIALAGVVLLAVLDNGSAAGASGGAVIVFFGATSLAIGLARFSSPEWRGRGNTGRALTSAFMPSIVAVVLAVLLAGLLSRELLDTIVWALAPLIWALGVVFRTAVFIVAIITVILLSPLLYLLSGRTLDLGPVRINGSSPFSDRLVDEATERGNQLPDAIRYLLAVAILVVLFSGVVRFVLRRRKPAQRGDAGEERETARPVIDVSGLLASLLRALGLGGRDSAVDPLAGLRSDPRWAATVRIRDDYARFLIWAGARGHARVAPMTPSDHAARLSTELRGDGARADTAVIARVYDAARYDGRPATAHDADTLHAAFERLERAPRTFD